MAARKTPYNAAAGDAVVGKIAMQAAPRPMEVHKTMKYAHSGTSLYDLIKRV